MSPRSLQFIVRACQGQLLTGAGDRCVRRVCTDSRQVAAGDLFVPLVGDTFDGNDFLIPAAERGAVAVLVAKDRLDRAAALPPGCGLIAVQDPRAALGDLAQAYRQDFSPAVIAVAGSNGKTTTKELVASVLREKLPTLASEASFNNDIGVPLTLLQLEPQHEAAVLEVGTNHPGELAPLMRRIAPRYGILTNIGREHLEFFHDVAGVAQEEGWLAELLPPEGRLFIHGDSEWLPAVAARTRAAVVTVGFSQKNLWRAEAIRMDAEGARFCVAAPAREFSGEFRVNILGRHQVLNALFALAIGMELGMSADQARRGLEQCAPPKMRLQVWRVGEITLLDDAYNANADSMLAALQTLHDFPASGRRVALLGDMAELGARTAAAHREVGAYAAQMGVQVLITVGCWAEVTAEAARAAGLTAVHVLSDVTAAITALPSLLKGGDVVLIKASRAAAFERIVVALRNKPG